VYVEGRGRTIFSTQADEIADSFEGRRYYGFGWVWRRLVAGLVDWVVAIVAGMVGGVLVQVEYALSGSRPFAENFVSGVTVWAIPGVLLVLLATHLAFGLLVSSTGRTLGQRSLGLRILRADGTRIGSWRSLGRQFMGSPMIFGYLLPICMLLTAWFYIAQRANQYMPLTWISEPVQLVARNWLVWGFVVCLVLIAVNHVLMFLDAKGRGWHDRLVGAVVARDRGVD